MKNERIALMLIGCVSILVPIGIIASSKMVEAHESESKKTTSQWNWEDSWDAKTEPTPKNEAKNKPQAEAKPEKKEEEAKPSKEVTVVASYEEAIKLSGKEGRPVIVVFGATWCGWCVKFKETLQSETVKKAMAPYILVHVDVDQNRAVSRKFGVSSLPATAITNYKQEKLKASTGYMNEQQFSNWIVDPSMYEQPKGTPSFESTSRFRWQAWMQRL